MINIDLERIEKIKEIFRQKYQQENEYLFSVPGRVEICGNHLDYNKGNAIAATVDLDMIVAVSKNDKSEVCILSKGYNDISFSLNDLECSKDELGHSVAIAKGIFQIMKQSGYNIGGIYIYLESNILRGGGISSSAAFEVMVGTIINELYNDNKVVKEEIVKIAKRAENEYLKKPCGLLDQLAIVNGGISYIDFYNKRVEKLNNNLENEDYRFLLVDTHLKHNNLIQEFSNIKDEMNSIVKFFEKDFLREINFEQILNNSKELENKYGARAVLRSIHFFNEMKNVNDLKSAINNDNKKEIIKAINLSGESSENCLQNLYLENEPKKQMANLVMQLSKIILGEDGAVRIHGGGFGGTILVYLKREKEDEYIEKIEKLLGKGSCYKIGIRNEGISRIE